MCMTAPQEIFVKVEHESRTSCMIVGSFAEEKYQPCAEKAFEKILISKISANIYDKLTFCFCKQFRET